MLSKDYLNTSIADVRISQSKSKAYDFRFLAGGVAAPVALRLGVAATFASAFEATGADLAFALALLSGLGFAAAFTFGLALAPADFSPLGTNDLAKAQSRTNRRKGLSDQKTQDNRPKVYTCSHFVEANKSNEFADMVIPQQYERIEPGPTLHCESFHSPKPICKIKFKSSSKRGHKAQPLLLYA